MTSESVAARRRQVLVGDLPEDFLRLSAPVRLSNEESPTHSQNPPVLAQYNFVPPNTRGRISVTIMEANLVKNYGLVRMDPYCRLRVGQNVFETQTKLSGGRNPTWNRTIHSYLPIGVESIYVQIFDEKAFSADECIAWAHIVLPQAIFNGEVIDEFFPLSGQQGEGKEGMLHLLVGFAANNVAPEAEANAELQQTLAASLQEQQAPPPQPVQITDEDTVEIQQMFPEVDKEVIRCVMEENRGNKDATVTAILQMTQSQ